MYGEYECVYDCVAVEEEELQGMHIGFPQCMNIFIQFASAFLPQELQQWVCHSCYVAKKEFGEYKEPEVYSSPSGCLGLQCHILRNAGDRGYDSGMEMAAKKMYKIFKEEGFVTQLLDTFVERNNIKICWYRGTGEDEWI